MLSKFPLLRFCYNSVSVLCPYRSLSKKGTSNARLKFAKNQAKVMQHRQTEFCYFKFIRILHPHPKIIVDILKICTKNKWVCFNDVI